MEYFLNQGMICLQMLSEQSCFIALGLLTISVHPSKQKLIAFRLLTLTISFVLATVVMSDKSRFQPLTGQNWKHLPFYLKILNWYFRFTREEALVQWDLTQFPQLVELRRQMEPFDRLWRTALEFDTCNRNWLQAPYHTLNPFDVEQQVSDMYKTMHKLTKTLAELPGPAKVAQKMKVSFALVLMMFHDFSTPLNFCTLVEKYQAWPCTTHHVDTISCPLPIPMLLLFLYLAVVLGILAHVSSAGSIYTFCCLWLVNINFPSIKTNSPCIKVN